MKKDSDLKLRKEIFSKLFRPACYGDSIHCPVLFTRKMYECEHHVKCELETQKNFAERLRWK